MPTPSQEDFTRGWLKEISRALKREKNFRKEGVELLRLYEAEDLSKVPFNILFSNTDTLLPALYNSTPRPVVQRRFKDEDPLGRMAAHAGQRILEYLVDDGMSQYESFDDLMKASVLPALVPGRGVVRFKYEAEFEPLGDGEKEAPDEEALEEAAEETPAAAPAEQISYETVCGESVQWNDILFGYAKKWSDVPWVAYRRYMTRKELEENFPDSHMLIKDEALSRLSESENASDDEDHGRAKAGDVESESLVAEVYEIWHKDTRKVIFVTDALPEQPLKVVDDPLKLAGFFNCPKPLMLFQRVGSLIPIPLYRQYKTQAEELNRVTTRIKHIVAALRVRGAYDSTVQGLEKILEAEDNTMIPVQNMPALYAQTSGMDKALWIMPIEKLVAVLQQLYAQRESVKQIIFELMGVADIMRGSSQASETYGAQKLKDRWGSLRMKRLQKEVARYARDSLRLMLEVAVNRLGEETIRGMTGLPYPTQAEKAQAVATLQQIMAVGQEPPQDLLLQAQLPSWKEILELLRDDLQRSYRIEIETNSTVDAEATEDKENIAELLNAISQFLNGVGPLVQDGSMPFEVAQGMLLAIVRRFRFGPELEEHLRKMQPPQPKEDPKAQGDMQRLNMELQKMQQEMAFQKETHQMELEKMQEELAFFREKLQLDREKLQLDAQLAAQKHRQAMEAAAVAAVASKRPAKPAGVTKP